MSDKRFTDLIRRVHEFIRASGESVRSSHAPMASVFAPLAAEVFAAQFDAVAPYQALCRARGITLGHLLDWREIPAVPTSAFKELEFTSLPPDQRVKVFLSSGTTQHPRSRHFHSVESIELYEASLKAWFQPHLLPGFAETNTRRRFLVLAPPVADAPHSSLVHMFNHVVTEFGGPDTPFLARCGSSDGWQLDAGAAVRALVAAEKEGQPVVLLGTAFMFVFLLDHLEHSGMCLSLAPGSRVLETGGYKSRSRQLPKAELHAWITRRLGVPRSQIMCEYGMSELGSQAYDRAVPRIQASVKDAGSVVARGFRFPPWARAWVVSPEDGQEVAEGETGLLRVLDLANVRSVIAVQTEDLAVRQGGGFELLGRAPRAEAKGCSLLAV